MGAIAFLVLFLLGLLLATAGGIIGLVDAFRVSPVWGLLSFFVPFALLVFCIKFWNRKWARNSLIISLGGLGVMLLSTPLLGAFIAQRGGLIGASMDDNQAVDEVPIESVPVPSEEPAAEETFAEPLVPVAPQLSPIARADLIQSTDPSERLREINRSRTDPFAVVAIPPAPQLVVPPPPPAPPTATGATPTPVGTTAAGPGSPSRAGSTVARAPGTAGAVPGTSSPSGATTPAGAPGQAPGNRLPLAPLPALPQPTQAATVLVTGVMTIGNENFAVVQTDLGSQYVRVGQRVSNGQVLVKRIDVRGSDPVVVLEQNGIEVSRPVGGPAPEENGQPAA